MNNLKKRLGTYNAADVDKLLFKVRSDYELCIKEQKERIFQLREQNREMASLIERYRSDERYIIGAITKAEEIADSIISDAQKKARERLEILKNEEKQIRTAIEGCCQRLYKLKRASEAIYRAVSKVMGENDEPGNISVQYPGLHAVKVFPASRIQD